MAEGKSLSDSKCLVEDITAVSPSKDDADQVNFRTLRTRKRELQLSVDSFVTSLDSRTTFADMETTSCSYRALENEIISFLTQLSSITCDTKIEGILERVEVMRDTLRDAYQKWSGDAHTSLQETPEQLPVFPDADKNTDIPQIKPTDSISNVGTKVSMISLTPSQLARKQISLELEKQKLAAQFELEKQKLEYTIRQAELEAKEKCLALSNPNSVIGRHSPTLEHLVQPTTHTASRERLGAATPTQHIVGVSPQHSNLDVGPGNTLNHNNIQAIHNNTDTAFQPHIPQNIQTDNTWSPPPQNYYAYNQPNPYVQCGTSTSLQNPHHQGSPHSSGLSNNTLQEYHILLEEAREIRYSGHSLPFIFYQNQIMEIIKRCPIPHRKMDLLRASCQEGAREAISALVPPVPGWDVDTQVKRALEGLRLRYGCCSFLAEPLVRQIRSGPKLSRLDAGNLEKLISDLNDCELYARAHKQTISLDSGFIIDIGERLPFSFKNRYADYLLDNYGSTEQPTFESFKRFLDRELNRVNTTFAQRFLASSQDRGERNRHLQKVKVHQTKVNSQVGHSPPVPLMTPHYDSRQNAPSEAVKRQQLPVCFVCSTQSLEKRHYLYSCEKYLRLTQEERRSVILQARRCLNCLQPHTVEDCKQPCKCKHCKHTSNVHKHTTTLHELFNSSPHTPYSGGTRPEGMAHGAASSQSSDQTHPTSVVRKMDTQQTGVFTRISAVRIINPQTGAQTLAYAQHDPGSQVTLMTSSLVQELGLVPERKSCFTLHTLSSSETRQFEHVLFDLETLHTHERFFARGAVVTPPWSDEGYTLPHNQDLFMYPHFEGITTSVLPTRCSVDILLGLDNSALMRVLQERTGKDGEPHAIQTPLGWIASGGKFQEERASYQTRRVCARQAQDLDDSFKRKQWVMQLEETVRDLTKQEEVIQPSISDKKAQEMVEKSIKIVDDRYQMPVPLKAEINSLPNNHELAVKRARALRHTMLKQPDLQQALVDTMKELKENNYIVQAEDNTNEQTNYLPYFMTTQAKPRLVYDGSAKWSGTSINDFIYSGPDLLNVLAHVLARFRKGKYALMSDISKCFFQILLPEHQQNLFRIIWYKNDDIINGEFEIYKFTRHVWGIISSPYIACRAIREVAKENPLQASSLTVNTMLHCMYMDDFLFSTDTLDNAQLVASESIDLFASRGFQLVKWTANKAAKSILDTVGKDKLAPSVRTIDLKKEDDPLPSFKAVGCVWNADQDVLKVQFSLDQPTKYTRRALLSQISKQYDPLGYTAPLLLKGRLVLQQLAMDQVTWDEPIDSRHEKAWKEWLETLTNLKGISIPRWYFANGPHAEVTAEHTYQLHAFSDASNEAYGSVIYLQRIVNGNPSTAFVFGKSRVVLLNQQNWPVARKELVAAVMSAELMDSAVRALQLPNCTLHFWCDSRVVLQWITNPDLRLPKFIARRLEVIHRISSPNNWHYCETSTNPADVATRPLTTRHLSVRLKLWQNGPEFLHQPLYNFDQTISTVTLREARVTLNQQTSYKGPDVTLFDAIQAAPNWYTLKKRASYLISFVEYLKAKAKKQEFKKPHIDASYLEKAMHRLVQYVQRECFGMISDRLHEGSPDCLEDTIKRLIANTKSPSERKNLADLRSIRCLRPCAFPDGILRIEGRLGEADLPTDEKHPIILPSRHPFTRLLIRHCHEENAHAGIQYTLMLTRRQFWVIKGLSSVRHYLSKCNACNIQKAKPVRQLMADLPACRMAAHNKPFFNTGCDYFGPLMYKEGRSERKAWGLLFTCLTTRAVHVELTTSLDLNSFILAFSRFVDLRGPVSSMYSDNGTTFKAAAHILPELLQAEELQSFFRKKGMSWEFIPPYSPSQGGAWESLIKVFKRTLSHVTNYSARTPSLVELQTYISNSTRLVNERPLTPLSDDPRDYTAISPSSLLTPIHHPLTPIGQPHDRDHLRRDYRFNTALAQKFWERWVKFYLPLLQKRKKWFTTTDNLCVGQLVLVAGPGDFSKRGSYRLGRISEVLPQVRRGKALVRRVRIAVSSSGANGGEPVITLIDRDLSKVAPLELSV